MNRTFQLICIAFSLFIAATLVCGDIKTLKKQLKSKDNATAYNATAELAAYYRQNGDLKEAERLLKDFQNPGGFDRLSPKTAIPYLCCLLETAHIRALKKDIPGALQLLNWAEARKHDYERAIACLKYGEILIDLNEPERASAYLANVNSIVAKHLKGETDTGAAIGQGSQDVDSNSAWENLRDQSDYLAATIEELQLNKKFGATYGLYVKLRRLQRIIKRSQQPRYFNEAMRLCDEITDMDPKSQFAAAVGYLKGQILFSVIPDSSGSVQKTAIRNAEKHLEKFIKDNPNGLYRGEAWMLLGKIALEKEWDAKDAEKYYSQALEWFKTARKKRDALSLYAPLSDDLKKQTVPTQKPTSLNQWERVVYNPEDPLKLYNTEMSPSWYVNEKEKQCLFRMGFFNVVKGNFAEAEPYFTKVLEYDSELKFINSKGTPNIVSRLLAVCKYKRMIFTSEELAKLNNNERLKICTGDLYYITSQFDEAIKVYRSVLADKSSCPTARACALAGIANSLEMGYNDFTTALSYFNRILADKELNRTSLAPRALFHYAENIYSSANMKDAVKPFEECVRKYPKSEFGELSMFKLVAIAYFDSRRRGDMKYRQYLAKYPAANYKKNVEYMVSLMEKDRGKNW